MSVESSKDKTFGAKVCVCLALNPVWQFRHKIWQGKAEVNERMKCYAFQIIWALENKNIIEVINSTNVSKGFLHYIKWKDEFQEYKGKYQRL